jgi:general secretion pathway protein D
MIPSGSGDRLIMRTSDPVALETALALAERLDIEDAGEREIHVVRLANADPVKVTQALNAISSGKAGPGDGKGDLAKGGPGKGGVALADEANRAIIIAAPEGVYRSWRGLIGEMDRRPGQIYVEALVVEVTSEKMAEFGIQWQSLRGMDPTRAPRVAGIGGTNLGGDIAGTASGLAGGNPSMGAGLGLGLISGTITLANGTVVPNLLALARALETDADANILSTPTLLALDGEEAKMLVGQNVPLVTGSYAPATGGTTGAVTPFQTIERRDVGLTLRIKPRITESSTVRLDIYQEVSSLLPVTVKTGASDVVTNKRSLESRVLVEDGQIIVLGGLMQDRLLLNEEKVPILGSIPIIGQFFRYEKRTRGKISLMVFIRPTIVRKADDAIPMTMDLYSNTRKEQEGIQPWPNLLLPYMPSPQSPEFQLKKENKAPAEEPKP